MQTERYMSSHKRQMNKQTDIACTTSIMKSELWWSKQERNETAFVSKDYFYIELFVKQERLISKLSTIIAIMIKISIQATNLR